MYPVLSMATRNVLRMMFYSFAIQQAGFLCVIVLVVAMLWSLIQLGPLIDHDSLTEEAGLKVATFDSAISKTTQAEHQQIASQLEPLVMEDFLAIVAMSSEVFEHTRQSEISES